MKGSIDYYTGILKERLVLLEDMSNTGMASDLLEECNCLVELGEHFLLSTKTMPEGAKDFFEQKRKLKMHIRDVTCSRVDGRHSQAKPLLENSNVVQSAKVSETMLTAFQKKLALESIKKKVEEITELNTYINSFVDFQGDNIDNIARQIQNNSEENRKTVVQLENALRHRQSRNKIYNFILMLAFFLILVFLTFRVVLGL